MRFIQLHLVNDGQVVLIDYDRIDSILIESENVTTVYAGPSAWRVKESRQQIIEQLARFGPVQISDDVTLHEYPHTIDWS